MPTYVEYDLGDGATLLVEATEGISEEIVRASRGSEEATVVKAKKTFTEAFQVIKEQSKMLLNELDSLKVNEAEIKFGINTTGELGNLAIGKIGVGVNYEVTLKWKKPDR